MYLVRDKSNTELFRYSYIYDNPLNENIYININANINNNIKSINRNTERQMYLFVQISFFAACTLHIFLFCCWVRSRYFGIIVLGSNYKVSVKYPSSEILHSFQCFENLFRLLIPRSILFHSVLSSWLAILL